MAEWPDHPVDDTHADRGIEPGNWIFVGLRYPGCAEQNVPQWQKSRKVLVTMLWHRRVMNAVPLRAVHHSDHAPHWKTNVQMSATVRNEVDEADNEHHIWGD